MRNQSPVVFLSFLVFLCACGLDPVSQFDNYSRGVDGLARVSVLAVGGDPRSVNEHTGSNQPAASAVAKSEVEAPAKVDPDSMPAVQQADPDAAKTIQGVSTLLQKSYEIAQLWPGDELELQGRPLEFVAGILFGWKAHASGSGNEKTLSQKELDKIARDDRDVAAFTRQLMKVAFTRLKPGKEQKISIHLWDRHGKELHVMADRSWERSCDLASRIFPSSQALVYEGRSRRTKKVVKVRHPFGGSSCTSEIARKFKIYNFDLAQSSAQGDEGGRGPASVSSVPSISLIMSRRSRNEVWVLYNGTVTKGEGSLLGALQGFFRQAIDSERMPVKPQEAMPLENFEL